MTITATAVRPLSRAEVEYLRGELARPLTYAQKRQGEVKGPERLYWSARIDALNDALNLLDALCASEPWYEPESVAPTT